ncbi:phage holin family protein [Prosthecobacter sp.]|uniref:phage holin family protein n=1 Tax=Prosthecobacter sp. TaxID=1965333 RepID=UPI0037848977
MNPGTPPAPEERASAAGMLRAIALYVEARGRLLHIEGQEAGSRLINLSGMFILAFGALVIGWMLAAPALVWLVAEAWGWHWSKVALAGAGIHLFIGLLIFLGLKSRLRGLHLFEETFHQFRRDRECLTRHKNP